MSRYWDGGEKGQRLPEAIPVGLWRSFTLPGAMSDSNLVDTMTVESSNDAYMFLSFLDQILCPQLRDEPIVAIANVRTHKLAVMQHKIEATVPPGFILSPVFARLQPIESVGQDQTSSSQFQSSHRLRIPRRLPAPTTIIKGSHEFFLLGATLTTGSWRPTKRRT